MTLSSLGDGETKSRFEDEVRRIYAVNHDKPPFGRGGLSVRASVIKVIKSEAKTTVFGPNLTSIALCAQWEFHQV